MRIVLKPWMEDIKGGKWKYVTSTAGVFEFVGIKVNDCTIRYNGKLLGFVRDNCLTIMAGYAWNGMSFYPESKKNKIDSLLHDFFYQTGLIPRSSADLILRNMASLHDKKSGIIYLGVRTAGWLFYAKDPSIVITYL